MTAEDKVVKRILAAGSAGVKKADLRKELGDIDAILEKVISRGEVFVEKRASAYYCWHKDYYVQSLLNSDPRFRLTYDMLRSLEESVTRLAGNLSNLARLVMEIKGEQSLQSLQPTELVVTRKTMSINDFKNEFDTALANSSSSIGWVELAKLRNELCDRCGLSADEFYRLVADLTNQNQDRYELSTGGGEGVMVRGLLHGFVRCI